jgi:hypothetical protein
VPSPAAKTMARRGMADLGGKGVIKVSARRRIGF